ncbi:hypothetical protein [Shewanella sediminis]|nr:hypothetical protein [Shewanella sediminis]
MFRIKNALMAWMPEKGYETRREALDFEWGKRGELLAPTIAANCIM